MRARVAVIVVGGGGGTELKAVVGQWRSKVVMAMT